MKRKKRERKSFADIDKYRLDDECSDQPKRYLKYASLMAKAQDDVSRLEDNFKVIKAEIAHAIRTEPKLYGLTRATDKAVEEAVYREADYREFLERIHDAKHKLDVYKAACRALEHRKVMLENLTYLHGQSYFSDVRPRGEAGKELRKKSARRPQRDDE